MKKLKINELIILENKFYRIVKSKYHNRSLRGGGMRVILKLLREKELNDLILKGGLKQNGNIRVK